MAQGPLLDTRRHTRGTCSATCVQFSQGSGGGDGRASTPALPASPHGVGTEIWPSPASRRSGWGLFQVAVPGSTDIETSAGALQMFVERVYEKTLCFRMTANMSGGETPAARPPAPTSWVRRPLGRCPVFNSRPLSTGAGEIFLLRGLNRESSGGGRRERGRAPLLYGGDWSQGTAA